MSNTRLNDVNKHQREMSEIEQPMQTPLIDLEQSALEHYEKASSAIHHWSSDIPKAIKFYYKWKQLNFWGRLKLIFNTKER